jgi:hypothetical protein
MMKESLLKFLRKSRGRFYAGLYRLSVFLVSVLRVAVLAVLLPFPSARLDKRFLRQSLIKWYKILRWSVGLEAWTRQKGNVPGDFCVSVK